MGECLFCRIVRREIPATLCYEDEATLAFDDIRPQAPVHSLIIPKRHVVSLAQCGELDRTLLGQLLYACAEVARQKGIDGSGYRVVTNSGGDAGQTVFHLHLHVMGGRAMSWPPG